VGIRVF